MNQEENNSQENKKDQSITESTDRPNIAEKPESLANKDNSKSQKRKFSKAGIVTIAVFSGILVIAIATYIIVSKTWRYKDPGIVFYREPEESLVENVDNSKNYNNENTGKKEAEEDSDNTEQELVINISPYYGKSRFDLSKCLFGCAEDYKSAASNGGSIWLRRAGDGKSSISLKGYGYLAGEYDIEFNDEIIDVYLAGFGNGGSQAILFLKKDGTVDYVFPYLQDNKDGLQKYSIDNVDNIAYFMQADGLEGGYYNLTILAFRPDGYFYDLGGYLNGQNDILHSQMNLTTND